MKSIILALMLLAGTANAQNNYALKFYAVDTLNNGTTARGADTLNARVQDTTFGTGRYVRYDSIDVDTLNGLYNTLYVTMVSNSDNGDSVAFESFDKGTQKWSRLTMFDVSRAVLSNTLITIAVSNPSTTPITYRLNCKGVIYLRKRLLNLAVLARESRLSLEALNTY